MTVTRWIVISAIAAVPALGSAQPASDPAGPADGRQSIAALPTQWQDVIRNLRHPDVKVRLAAVEQLGNAGFTEAAEYVAPLVTDPDDRVQFAAIDAELTFFLIEPIGGRRVLSLTGGSNSRAQEAFEAGPLVRAAAHAPLVVLDNLAVAMRDGNSRIRFDAVHAIGVIGEAPLPAAQTKALLDGLEHYDAVIRAATARVLGRLRVVEAGDRLIASLNDSSPLVRRYAAEALGLIREARAVQSLTDLTAFYAKADMAGETLLALARIAHGSSRDLFRQRLSAPDPAIRRAAAEGLARLRDHDSLETLKAMMTSDPAPSARLAATFAVGVMDEPQAHVIAGALATDLGAQARDYLLELGAPAAPGVQAALGVATDSRYRADLIHVLGLLGTRDTIAVIEPFLKDKDERVSRAAANAIARLTAGQSGPTDLRGPTGPMGPMGPLGPLGTARPLGQETPSRD
jgi:HEAT repeat protein